jgi:N-sulfoglucosamine sulfohydrolase
MVETKDLGGEPEKELIKRELVKDLLATEYEARVKLHPKTPPVP